MKIQNDVQKQVSAYVRDNAPLKQVRNASTKLDKDTFTREAKSDDRFNTVWYCDMRTRNRYCM